jgi:nitrite reductase/ring-hydroxylating ferredoxin subunit/uncharacterized membrane protein
MRSRASYKGHPIHPGLIPFPFAFLTGAFVFDALAWLFDRPAFWSTGGHLALAGVLSALVAAVPGFIDYVYTVPPRSSGKRRATQHMALNLTVVALFTTTWLVREPLAPSLLVVAVELVAVGMLATAGLMGGVLVSRNQISVDHRYADAGKWNEATIDSSPDQTIDAAAADELTANQMKLLHVGGRRIVLARGEERHYAFDDRCSHKGGSLAGGVIICGTVQCPWHGSQFDARTGLVKAGPAQEPIRTCQVETRDERVYISPAGPTSLGA